MAKYFFDQLDKGKARRDAQKAQNQAVLANIIKMKQADDAQIRKQSNERFMQEYGFDYDETKQDDAQSHEFGIQDDDQTWRTGERKGAEGWQTGERKGAEKWKTGERIGDQTWRTSERLGEQGWRTSEREAAESWKTGERIGSEMHAIDMQEDDQAWRTGERIGTENYDALKQQRDFAGKKMLQDDSQDYDALKQTRSQTHDLTKLDKQAGYSMAELDKKLTAEEKNLATRLNHDMETLVIKESGLNTRQAKSIANDLHKFYKSNEWKVQAEKTKRENNIIDAIFALDMESKQKAKDFGFTANPFLLGKMTNMLGLNYKEGAVLDKVEGNIPALAQAVNIARNLPDVEVPGMGGLLGGMQQDPRKQEIISVLIEYDNHLDQKRGTLNPTAWDNESSSTRMKAKQLRNTVHGLLKLVNTPQAPIDPSIYTDRIR